MSKNKIYLLLFILGLSVGIFFGLNRVRASPPEGETSGGDQPASVYFDEHWRATQAIVSTESGFVNFSDFNSLTSPAGRIENTPGGWLVRVFPKMVVTKWRVHGHIHFE